MKRKLFCEICPLTYKISVCKEIIFRKLKDMFSNEKIASEKSDSKLEYIIKSHRSVVLRELLGVDMQLQENKRTNLEIASKEINGIIIKPGETFSFWRLIGRPTRKKGYLNGLLISNNGLKSGTAGGVCQLANLIHWLVLNSPLTVTELHHHSDALFPDSNRRVPFGTGTSVFYNNVDYRFKNTTDVAVQICVYLQEGDLCGELYAERKFPFRYRITEDDFGFSMENGEFYRNSKVYRHIFSTDNKFPEKTELILDNHSKVMYDYSFIPEDKIVDKVTENE